MLFNLSSFKYNIYILYSIFSNCVVKRLFKNSNATSGSSLNNTTKTLQRRSNKSIKSAVDLTITTSSPSTRSSSRRRHRSGPVQETLEASPYRRNKKNVLPIKQEDKQTSSRFSKHVQDFSSIFNRALSNVTKSILRYNSKS